MAHRSFDGASIFLTGASSGIGAELAAQLSDSRPKLTLVARRRDRLEETAAACRTRGAEVHIIAADLSEESSCRAAIDEAVAWSGGLDLLLLNAGISSDVRFDALTDLSILQRIMRTNFEGPVYCTAQALPHLKRSRGAIVVISSLQGRTGFPGSTLYAASKHALHGFFDSLRIELEGTGVQVTLICPGVVESEIHEKKGRAFDRSALMSTGECAARILEAVRRGRRELMMTTAGRLGWYLKPFFPALIDRIVRKKVEAFYSPPADGKTSQPSGRSLPPG